MEKISKRIIFCTEDGRKNVSVFRISIDLGGDLAYLEWEMCGEVYYIKVPKQYRRTGIATSLYKSAKEYVKKSGLPSLRHSEYRTEDGDLWAKSLGEQLPNIKL